MVPFLLTHQIQPGTVISSALPAMVVMKLGRLNILSQSRKKAFHLNPADLLPNVDILVNLGPTSFIVQIGDNPNAVFLSSGHRNICGLRKSIGLKDVKMIDETCDWVDLPGIEVERCESG